MAIPFLKGIDVSGAVDLSNLTIDGAQGTDGQVLTSTGTGVAWENAAAGTSETAERIEVTVKNVSGGSLSKGTVVHASPSANPPSGNVIEVIAADYDDSTKMPAIGILNETIADTAEGSAVMMGAVSGIDTSSFSIGDELYVGNLGTLTSTKPTTAGQLIQKIAVVIKSHASNGLIKIFGAGRSNDVPLPLYIDNANQRVGIGDSTPSYTLDVNGTIYGSSLRSNRYYGTSGTSSYLDLDSGAPYSLLASSEVNVTNSIICNDLEATEVGGIVASNGPVFANRFYGNGSTAYYLDPNDSTTSAILNGKVGIGTTSPSSKLHANGVVTIDGSTNGTSGSLAIQDNYSGANHLANIGWNRSSGGPYFSYGLKQDGSADWKSTFANFSGKRTYAKLDEDSFSMGFAPSQNTAVDSVVTNVSEKIKFDLENGRLGIGTTSPDSLLHLKSTGDVTLTLEADSDNSGENDNPLIELKQDGGGIISRFGNVGDAGQIFTNSRSNSTGLGSVYQQDLIFFTENSARVYVKGENGYQGRVGIGAATPSQILDVSGNVTANRYYGNGSTTYYVDPNNSTTAAVLAGGLDIGYGSAGEYRIEVGEGRTGNGYAYIDFVGDTTYSDYGLRLIRNNSGANTSSQLVHRGTGNLEFKTWDAGAMIFSTTNSERMRITSSGNVGIGIQTPGQKLDVSGNIKMTETAATTDTDKFVVLDSGVLKYRTGTQLRSDIGAGTSSFSGSYNDLSNKPTIPTNNNQLTNGAGYITSSGVAAKIKAGGTGPSTENLNTVANSVSTGQLEYRGYNSSSSNKPPASDNANGVITVGQHSGNYNAQLAFSSDGNIYWRDNPSSSFGSWRKMWDDGNDGAGSGLDADLLDGVQGASYLRSDTSDSFTGDELHFPTLDLAISNNNSQGNGNTYFRGSGTHFVLGLNNGNTCYLNYGNTSGALRLYGSSIYWNDSNIGSPWGNANDGSGSGLDADLLDGVQGADYFKKQNDIGGSVNLNTLTTDGYYHQNANANAASGSNYPVAAAGMLSVVSDGQMVYQTYHQYNGNAYYHRSYYNGAWYAWRKVWQDGNDGAGSGLDADTVDGIQGASFLRSDASDTATGQITITTSGNALTVTSQQSIGAIITGGNNSSDIIQLKKGSNIEAKLDTSGHWHVDGDVIAYSTSTSSDKKLKTNISTLTDALDKTIKLRGVNFDWIDENKPNNQVGFIAQEVEKVLPEVVKNVETLNKENETHKAVDYAAVVPLLVEAIKEQQKQIDELKELIK